MVLLRVLLFIWELPQNLLGLILIWGAKKMGTRLYTRKLMRSGISLGEFIILDPVYFQAPILIYKQTLCHELGHRRQSRLLGPLYLLLIGLPSITGNILSRIFSWSEKTYYSQPWEKWADKLGKVTRSYK